MSRSANMIVALAMTIMLAPPVASAVDLTIGIEGHFRIGQWTPVQVTDVAEGPVAILCTDPTGLVVKYPLAANGDRFYGLVQFANVTSRCMIVAGEEETPLATFVPSRSGVGVAHRSSERVWLVDSADVDFASARNRLNEFASEPDRASVVISNLNRWPAGAKQLRDALGAVNLVVLTQPVNQDTADALQGWVADGGHLLIVGGLDENFETESPLVDWLPIDVDGAARFRDLNVLEASVPSGRNLRLKKPLNGVRLSSNTGIAEIKSSFGPILLRAPYAFGRVSAFSLDLAEPVFQDWNSLPALCLILADENLQTSGSRGQTQNRLTRTGISEFETQLLATVDNSFDEGRVQTTLWQILGRLVFYGVLIAAIDYLLVHKLLRIPQLTWLTMPVWAIGVFYFVAVSGGPVSNNTPPADEANATNGRSDQLLSTTSLSVSDFDTTSGYAKFRSLISVGATARTRISPQLNRTFATSVFDPNYADLKTQQRLGWTAPPEENFGGRYRAQRLDLDGLAYQSADDRKQFVGIPVEPKGTRLFESLLRCEPAATFDPNGEVTNDIVGRVDSAPLIELDIEMRGVRPVGTITSRFPAPIASWSFAIGRQMIFPRETLPLDPNKPFRVDLESCDSRALRDVVTGIRRGVEPKGTSATGGRSIAERDEYDPTELSPFRALLTATFYERSGGISFSGVRNSGSPIGLDLSHLLDLDRVIFLGTLPGVASPIELQADGQDSPQASKQFNLCFLRVVCPLSSSE